LVKLCMDRSDFTVQAIEDPVALREAVFLRASRRRAEGEFSRGAVLAEIAAERGLAPELVEEGLYADLKENERLLGFKELDAEGLLHRYNMALAQSCLMRATKLRIGLRERDAARARRLFRALKFQRLLHRVEGNAEEGFEIVIDGPLSLFKQSKQYGLRMARFLPTLVLSEDWWLEARLEWGKQRAVRSLRLEPKLGLKSHARDVGAWTPDEILSLRERWPENSAWRMAESSEIVDLGGQDILIPDLVFVHEGGARVLLDVLGYWNKRSAGRRLEMLKRHGPENLILAVGRALCVGTEGKEDPGLDELAGEVYVYRNTILPRELEKRLLRWAPAAKSASKTKKKAKAKAKKKPKVKTEGKAKAKAKEKRKAETGKKAKAKD